MASRQPQLTALMGLRFVACLQVALAHMPQLHAHPSLNESLRSFMIGPGFAVPFFFIMSGFVLAYRYHDEFATLTNTSLFAFYRARLAKIWPVHLLTMGLAVYFSPNPNHQNSFVSAVLNIFMMQSWVPGPYAHMYNSTSWTLSIEWFLYLCLPLLLWLFTRDLHQSIPIWPLVPCWLIPLSWAIYLSDSTQPWTTYAVAICPLARLGEFVIGILLGLLFVQTSTRGATTTVLMRLTWTALEAASLIFVGYLFLWSMSCPMLIKANGLYTVPMSLVIVIFAFQRGYLAALLGLKGPAYLGEISYSFFMLHCIVFVVLNRLFPGEIDPWSRTILYFQTAIAVAILVYHGFELPMQFVIVRLSNRAPSADTAPPAVAVGVIPPH